MCDSRSGLLCTRQSKALACPSSIFYWVQKVRESEFNGSINANICMDFMVDQQDQLFSWTKKKVFLKSVKWWRHQPGKCNIQRPCHVFPGHVSLKICTQNSGIFFKPVTLLKNISKKCTILSFLWSFLIHIFGICKQCSSESCKFLTVCSLVWKGLYGGSRPILHKSVAGYSSCQGILYCIELSN
jgi:hypothetical protein